MHHLRKNQYPSAPRRSHHRAQPRPTAAPRKHELVIRKEFIPTVRPQPLHPGSPVVQKFQFLDLPGEVRNLVYSFCIPDAEHEFPMVFIFTRQVKSSSGKGLMGVCKQIRDEFRPIYWSVNGPMLKRYDIPNLMKVFFSQNAAANDLVRPARVTILLREYLPGYPEPQSRPQDFVIDLLPLAKAGKRAAGIKWHTRHEEWHCGRVEIYTYNYVFSNRAIELERIFEGLSNLDIDDLLAGTGPLVLRSLKLLHSVRRETNIWKVGITTSKLVLGASERDLVNRFVSSVTEHTIIKEETSQSVHMELGFRSVNDKPVQVNFEFGEM